MLAPTGCTSRKDALGRKEPTTAKFKIPFADDEFVRVPDLGTCGSKDCK
jgi:hypothetical protein